MRRNSTLLILLPMVVAACATTKTPATLEQARNLHQTLVSNGAEQRVDGDLIRARQAITQAEAAVSERRGQELADGLAHIALRATQLADANNARILASRSADSLRTARLQRLLTLSESQRAALAAQNQLSAEEIAELQRRNMLVSQRADSLRQREMMLAQQADSLRREAEAANARLNEAVSQLRTLVVEITNLQQTSRGLVISLSDILFDVNKATLKPGAEQNVRRIAAVLKQYPDHQIAVEGHTDATGSDEYNNRLSADRANSVRMALVNGGVDTAKISATGFGEAQPVATNDTPAGRQQNRRVEVVVLGAGTVGDAVKADSSGVR